MKTDIWMPLYIADFLAATTHLDAEESGAYLLVLMGAWIRGGKLADDNTALSRIAKVSEPCWNRIRTVLEPFFEIKDGFWVQRRLLIEKEKAEKRSAVRREVGKLGGRPTKETNSETNRLLESKANGKQTETPSQSHSQSQVLNERKGGFPTLDQVKTRASMTAMRESDAVDFWNHFESVGWIDKNGHPIVCWESKMDRWKSQAREINHAKRNSQNSPGRSGPTTPDYSKGF